MCAHWSTCLVVIEHQGKYHQVAVHLSYITLITGVYLLAHHIGDRGFRKVKGNVDVSATFACVARTHTLAYTDTLTHTYRHVRGV